MLRQRTVQQPPLFILIRFAGIAWLPDGGKALVFRRDDMRFNLKEIFGDEILNLFVTTHHQPQHRRLHTPDGEDALITGITPQNGVGAGHVDPVKPVRTSAGQRGNAQRNKLAVRAQT